MKRLLLLAVVAACRNDPSSNKAATPAANGLTGVKWEVLSVAGNASPPASAPAPALRSNSVRQSLALGLHHSCALADSGTVYCWGAVAADPVFTPTAVNGLPDGDPALQIAAGDAHTCALTASGAVWCWGSNSNGQLGVDPKTTPRSASPVHVKADFVFSQVAAGGDQTCALDASSTAWCWGSNGSGQLGDGTTSDSFKPLPVLFDGGAIPFEHITTSATHTCAAVGPEGGYSWGSVYCWGDDTNGQLGNVTTATRLPGTQIHPSPTRVLTVSRFTRGGLDGLELIERLASGPTYTCGQTIYGNYYCWGDNSLDQLGVVTAPGAGNSISAFSEYPPMYSSVDFGDPAGGEGQITFTGGPVTYTSGSVVYSAPQIVSGSNHVCVLPPDGRAARCWGSNSAGQLGPQGPAGNAPTWVPVAPGGGAFTELAAGGDHTCGISSNGEIYCWGDNSSGELGSGAGPSTAVPQRVAGGPYFPDVSAPKSPPPAPTGPPIVNCTIDPNAGGAPNNGNLSSYLFYLGDVFTRPTRIAEIDFNVWTDSATLANELELTVYSHSDADGYARLGSTTAANAFASLGSGAVPAVRFLFDGGLLVPRPVPVVLQITQRSGLTLTMGANLISNAGTAECPIDRRQVVSIPLQIYTQ